MSNIMDRTFEAGSLTREQFIEYIRKDFIAAKMVYDALEATAARKRRREAEAKALENIKAELTHKYKRQSTRDKYAMPMYEAWKERNKWRFRANEFTYADWSIRPWENGGCISISVKDLTDEFLGSIYDRSADNKYFRGCTGWEIVEKGRTYFKLILPDELQAEWDADEKKLSDAISRFYAGTNYWGD